MARVPWLSALGERVRESYAAPMLSRDEALGLVRIAEAAAILVAAENADVNAVAAILNARTSDVEREAQLAQGRTREAADVAIGVLTAALSRDPNSHPTPEASE